MAIELTVNGQDFEYPETGDKRWGSDATDWAQAVTVGMLQKAGGLFLLLAEVDFGQNYGIKSLYLKSRAANPASSGVIRLGNDEEIVWRNAANDDEFALKVNSSDVLEFDGQGISIGGNPVQEAITTSDTSQIDLTLDGSNVLSGVLVAGGITNTEINAAAAIAFSKLASLTSANILLGNGSNVATATAVSGDITIGNTGVTAIGSNKVTNAMLAQMATQTIKGNNTGGTANALDLTVTQVTAMLNNFVGDSGSGGTKGLVPAPASGDAAANKFLSAGGTWSVPTGAGDVTGPASATDSGFARFDGTTGKVLKNSAATIANADVSASAAIAYSKLALTGSIVNADISASAAIAFSKLASLSSANIIVGNGSSVPTAVAVTGDISLSNAGVTAYNGTVPLNKGGTNANITAANGGVIYSGSSALAVTAAGTSGQYLGSNGAAAPTWKSFVGPTVQVFTSSGTWTKPAGLIAAKVTVVGGGGGAGGSALTAAGEYTAPTAGSGGGCAIKFITAASLGATETVTIGAGGTGGAAGNNNGTAGGNTTFGAHATGGAGGAGTGSTATTLTGGNNRVAGGTASGGDFNIPGGDAIPSRCQSGNTIASQMSHGGTSCFANQTSSTVNANGINATGYGGGGSCGYNTASQAARSGGNGSAGIVIVEEYY